MKKEKENQKQTTTTKQQVRCTKWKLIALICVFNLIFVLCDTSS